VIFVSCVYANEFSNSNSKYTNSNKYKNRNKNDIEKKMYSDDESNDSEDSKIRKIYKLKDRQHKDEHINEINMIEKTKPNSKKVIQAQLIPQKNPFYPKSKSLIALNTNASYCKYRRGFLQLVKNPEKLGPNPFAIKTVPVYVDLNQSFLYLRMGLSPRTLFSQTRVEKILRIAEKFKNANCFEIVKDDIDEKTLAKSPFTLCADNKIIMMQWVRAIQEFKECSYNVDSKNDGSETLMDFKRINTLAKLSPLNSSLSRDKEQLKPLFYKTLPVKNKSKSKQVEVTMKNQLEKIVELLEEGSQNKQRLTRKIDTKLKSAEKIEEDIRMKKNIINGIISKRESIEQEKENKIRTDVHKKREMQLLKAVRSRIQQYKVI
jgi:hypothetical protein